MSWNEDRLHRWLERRTPPPGVVGGLGNDAVCLRSSGERPVWCTDHTIEGVHAAPDVSAAKLGRKAADRALSDLAAMGARPLGLQLALSAPASREEAWMRAAIGAVDRRGRLFEAPLLGGDLAAAPGGARLVVSALGSLPARTRPPGRDRARPGQLLVLTGAVGGSGLGRHLAIEPRLAMGRILRELGATAMMDTTDGLLRDLGRLARASAVRIELEEIAVHRDARRAARSSGRDPRWHALFDGEDHELLATLPARAWELAAKRLPGLLRVGRVRRGRGLYHPAWADGQPERSLWDGTGGWIHGA